VHIEQHRKLTRKERTAKTVSPTRYKNHGIIDRRISVTRLNINLSNKPGTINTRIPIPIRSRQCIKNTKQGEWAIRKAPKREPWTCFAPSSRGSQKASSSSQRHTRCVPGVHDPQSGVMSCRAEVCVYVRRGALFRACPFLGE
jgi:hypothetical protein